MRQLVEETLRAWILDIPEGIEALWGKKVLELRPIGFGKGKSVLQLAARHPECIPLYIGDDTTDEEAFTALNPEAVTIEGGRGCKSCSLSSGRYRKGR